MTRRLAPTRAVPGPNPDALALAVCDLDGTVVAAGDDKVLFDLQSASKPFVYALTLDQKGVGREVEVDEEIIDIEAAAIEALSDHVELHVLDRA